MSSFIFLLLAIFATITFMEALEALSHKGASKKISIIFALLAINSSMWSVFFGAIPVQTDPEYAYLLRCLGMIGTFGTLIFAAVLICEWVDVCKPTKYTVIGFSLLGIIIFPFNIRREYIEFIDTKIGMSYRFKPNVWTNIYLVYSVVIAILMFAMVIRLIRHTDKKRKKIVGIRLMWALIVICVGMLFDTILPAFGITAIPSSTIGQALAIFIIYSGLDFNKQNHIDVDNITAYIDTLTEVYLIAFNENLNLTFASTSAKKFFKIDCIDNYTFEDLFDYDKAKILSIEKADKLDALCKTNNIFCNLGIEKIKDDFGDIIGYIIAATDLTNRMKYINELNEAKKNADKANATKSAFLANMSHEIRTPLNAVLGMDEMIMREDNIHEIHSHAASIMDAGKSLLSIIDDILDFTKIESGMMHIIKNDYYVSEEIRELYNIVSFRAKRKGLDLYFDIDTNIPKILYGDEIRIRQILINIINNAIKYTKTGWVKVSLKAEFTDNSNIVLIGTVEDTGIGIKKEDIVKLFDKFLRLDESINHKVEGTGLGLSIVYNLLQMMDGTIEVQSVYQRGSIFTVRIPQVIVDKAPVGTVDLTYSSVTSNYKESFTAPNAKILVVDDNQINLTIVKGLLKKTLINIDLASSGRECLDMVTKKSYDIILLDHMMPEMNGLEVLTKLRAMDSNLSRNCPVIALTANAIVGAREQYLSAGFNDYLSKPIDYKELEAVIKKHLPSK